MADVLSAHRRDRRCLEPEAGRTHRLGCLVHHRVAGVASVGKGWKILACRQVDVPAGALAALPDLVGVDMLAANPAPFGTLSLDGTPRTTFADSPGSLHSLRGG